MSLFARALARRGKTVELSNRAESFFNGLSQVTFTPLTPATDIALIKTLRGKTVFDRTNVENVATHELRLNWRADVEAEQWVTFRDRHLRILTAENCCEDDNVLVLVCTERGEDSVVVNNA